MSKVNKLTLHEEELLHILTEECCEVGQASSKCLRHGFDAKAPGKTEEDPDNLAHLIQELADLQVMIDISKIILEIDEDGFDNLKKEKVKRMRKDLHHLNIPYWLYKA